MNKLDTILELFEDMASETWTFSTESDGEKVTVTVAVLKGTFTFSSDGTFTYERD